MNALKSLLVVVIGLVLATAQFDCGEAPCDGPQLSVEGEDVNVVPSTFSSETGTIVKTTNSSALQLMSGEAAEISISVGEITAWLQQGGSNPIEVGVISKLTEFINAAGIVMDGGALVYEFSHGREVILDGEGTCSDVTLLGGWHARGALHPGFRISFSFGVDGLNLKLRSEVKADTDFIMNCHVKLRKGFRVFGACVRPIVKTVGLDIGAYVALNMVSALDVCPYFHWDRDNAVVGWMSVYALKGQMLAFRATSHVEIKIFGIHLSKFEREVERAIRDELGRAFSQDAIDASFSSATRGVQRVLDDLLTTARVVIPNVPAELKPLVEAALAHLTKRSGCEGRRPPRPSPDGDTRPTPRPAPGPQPPAPAPGPGPRPRPIRP